MPSRSRLLPPESRPHSRRGRAAEQRAPNQDNMVAPVPTLSEETSRDGRLVKMARRSSISSCRGRGDDGGGKPTSSGSEDGRDATSKPASDGSGDAHRRQGPTSGRFQQPPSRLRWTSEPPVRSLRRRTVPARHPRSIVSCNAFAISPLLVFLPNLHLGSTVRPAGWSMENPGSRPAGTVPALLRPFSEPWLNGPNQTLVAQVSARDDP